MKLFTTTFDSSLFTKFLSGTLFILYGAGAQAQVSHLLNPTYGYTFLNTTTIYAPLGGGTVFQSGSTLNTDAVSAAITLPTVFTYNGIKENTIFISNNGFITFAKAQTTVSNTVPLSTTTTSGYDGAIAGLANNLVAAASGTPEIRYGTNVGGDFVVQFQDLAISGSTLTRITFQIILSVDGKTVQIVYGPNNTGQASVAGSQVGLRGTNDEDWNNRSLASGGNWNTAGGAAGTSNTSTMTWTASSTLPTSGRTFQWSPTAYTPVYSTTPFSSCVEFTAFVNGSGPNNVPSTNWATNGYGNASWQIDNTTATTTTSGWTSTGGAYSPADYVAASGGHSARFQAFFANSPQVGYLDYYVNFSTATGVVTLDFYQINPSGTDILQVFLSTDGGTTFNQVGSNIGTATTWTARSISLGAVTAATSIIRFKATSDFGSDGIGIDHVCLSLPVTCAAPASLAAGSITTNSASLSWACAGCTGTYRVEYNTSPATFGGAGNVVIDPATSPVAIAGLNAGTTYTFFVRQDCGGAGFSTVASANFTTNAAGETCTDAATVAVAANLGAAVNTLLTTGLTADGPPGTCSDATGNPNKKDRWIKFVAPSNGKKIIITTSAGTLSDAVMQVWASCPATGSALGCSDDVNVLMPELSFCQNEYVAGQTYYVQLWPYSSSATGNFNVKIYEDVACVLPTAPACVAAPTAPVNGGTVCAGTVSFSWPAVATATAYDVYVDAVLVSNNQAGTSYSQAVAAGPHTWSIVPSNAIGEATGCIDFTFTAAAAPTGNTFADPIIIGMLPASIAGNNLSANCWTNNFTTSSTPGNAAARSTNDVFYQITTGPCTDFLTMETVLPGSATDTYMHFLNAGGATLESDDDDGAGNLSLINYNVAPNTTYYIVVETFSAEGSFTLNVTATDIAPLSPITITACDSYTWPLNGQTYTESGTYTAPSTNGDGCTQTQSLVLTINLSTSNTTTETACDSYTWSENNVTYTSGGTYTVTSINAAGCLHTEILVLTINLSSSNTTTETACDSYTWSENNVTYTASGTYTVTSTNAAGCTHTETLVLTVNYSTPVTVTASGPTTFCGGGSVILTSSAATGNVWSPGGATTQSITVTTAGSYTVAFTNASGCTSISAPTVITLSPCTISGNIVWEENSAPVNSVSVALKTLPALALVNTGTTDVSGNYTVSTPNGGNFRIIPTKNTGLLNGVNAADATRIQQHVANTNPLPGPYKRIAADVNKSNTITSADATLITQAIAGNPAALLTFNTSWRFVPTTHVFSNPNIPWGFPEKIDLTGVTSNVINQNFTAIKIGDVNGTANPQLKPGPPVVWTVNDQLLTAGETIKVTFRAANFSDIAAYQFALGFDPSQLELADIQSAGVLELTDDNFGAYNVQDGELRAVWNAELGKTLSDGTTVFTVEFVALESGLKLSEVLHLDNSIVEAQAFNTDLVGTDVQLVFSPEEVSGTTDPLQQQSRVTLLQNIPNPFVGQTTIGFVLPEACEARLRIIDINGRVVAEVKKTYTAGYQQEIFELMGYTGVLCYELATPFGTVTRKMTSVK